MSIGMLQVYRFERRIPFEMKRCTASELVRPRAQTDGPSAWVGPLGRRPGDGASNADGRAGRLTGRRPGRHGAFRATGLDWAACFHSP